MTDPNEKFAILAVGPGDKPDINHGFSVFTTTCVDCGYVLMFNTSFARGFAEWGRK
jgi:hypothetical protein